MQLKRHFKSRLYLLLGFICAATFFQVGCGRADFITKPEEIDLISKYRSGKYELLDKESLAALRDKAAIGSSVGRYQRYANGLRTWRLDTATGENCLLLTTNEDWKNLDTVVAACKQ